MIQIMSFYGPSFLPSIAIMFAFSKDFDWEASYRHVIYEANRICSTMK